MTHKTTHKAESAIFVSCSVHYIRVGSFRSSTLWNCEPLYVIDPIRRHIRLAKKYAMVLDSQNIASFYRAFLHQLPTTGFFPNGLII
jgi:hypothetical protein